jgi:riboflavin biosynthesis pyrimidine reductase
MEPVRLLFAAEPAEPSDPAAALAEGHLTELYRHPSPQGRPVWVRSNFVTSLDGSISGPDGRSGSIGTPSDQHVFALHRALTDVVLVGAQTARAEGYRAVDLAPWQRELRAREQLSPFPLLAVVTRSLRLDPQIVANADLAVGPVLVLTTEGKTAAELGPLVDAGIEVVQLPGDSGVDLTAAMTALAGRGLPRVLCEGGSRLHRDLLAADLLDEMSLTLAPVVVGGDGARTTAGGPLPDARAFDLAAAVHADDGALFLRYRRRGRPRG